MSVRTSATSPENRESVGKRIEENFKPPTKVGAVRLEKMLSKTEKREMDEEL
jgi:hypothetical protein